jgi:nucleoid DNA-binding protein
MEGGNTTQMDEKTILISLASKYNLPISKVQEAVYHQFKYTNKVIREGKFESVRLPYFGKFHVNPGRLKHLNERPTND